MKFDQLITSLQELDGSLKKQVAQSANVGLTLRNWVVGAYIVEFEQNGEEQAKYGENLLAKIAEKIMIKGLSIRNLEASRLFYRSYSEIPQTVSAELLSLSIRIPQTPSAIFHKKLKTSDLKINQTQSRGLDSRPSDSGQKSQTASDLSERPDFALPAEELFQKLSFSHFVELLRLSDPLQRAFYEIECIKSGWSVRELKRQIGSLLFERLGLSTDKDKLLRLTSEETSSTQPSDFIKDPYIFEFLGLTPKEAFRENDLETALLDHLQDFLLELGAGFCFEDRQKKIRIGTSDYFVDLVFYHRKLHCHVLVELKVEPFNHTNAGQLNTYLSYYKKHEMAEGDNPPIGLLLCTDKDHTLVEYALGGMDENLFVSNYKVALPKREELEAFLRQQTDSSKS